MALTLLHLNLVVEVNVLRLLRNTVVVIRMPLDHIC